MIFTQVALLLARVVSLSSRASLATKLSKLVSSTITSQWRLPRLPSSGSGAITLQVKAQGSPSGAIQRATTGVYTVSQDVVTLNVATDVAYALQGSLAWDEASKTVSQAVGGSTQATLTISGLNPHPVEHTIDITVTGTINTDWTVSSGATVVGGLVV